MEIDKNFSLQIEDIHSLGGILPLLKGLSTSLLHHSQWTKVFHRELICKDSSDKIDISDNAHYFCKFGKWYHSLSNTDLKQDPCYQEVGNLHIELHKKAKKLLDRKHSGKDINVEVYDDFFNTANNFRIAVQDLQFSLISKICAVDHLTGVWNRHAMSYIISKEHERARRTGNKSAMAILDFDNFKQINDAYGHVAGDQALKMTIDFFVKRLRKYDIVFRYGGDEFLILFPETNIDQASQLLGRLQQELKNIPILIDDKNEVNISVSIGLSIMDGKSDYDETIKMADQALIEAKMEGRDCLRIWE